MHMENNYPTSNRSRPANFETQHAIYCSHAPPHRAVSARLRSSREHSGCSAIVYQRAKPHGTNRPERVDIAGLRVWIHAELECRPAKVQKRV
jgi:hypothetical protein